MGFSTRRGRPRSKSDAPDLGTPELRQKHQAGITSEPVDRCLEKGMLTTDQHRSALHLRWLYTLRYGAPSITTKYMEQKNITVENSEEWRAQREQEYRIAVQLLKDRRCYEPVMRLAVFNEIPAFMDTKLRQRAWQYPYLAQQLASEHTTLCDGLDLLARHWQRGAKSAAAATTQQV